MRFPERSAQTCRCKTVRRCFPTLPHNREQCETSIQDTLLKPSIIRERYPTVRGANSATFRTNYAGNMDFPSSKIRISQRARAIGSGSLTSKIFRGRNSLKEPLTRLSRSARILRISLQSVRISAYWLTTIPTTR